MAPKVSPRFITELITGDRQVNDFPDAESRQAATHRTGQDSAARAAGRQQN